MLTRGRASSSIVLDTNEKFLAPEKCRICLNDGELPIFGEEDLSEYVIEFGGIQVSFEDNLPQHLCEPCHELLQSAITFRKTALESDEILKKTDDLKQEDSSVLSDEEIHKSVESFYETEDNEEDNESVIKKEYLEYNSTSDDESDLDWKYEPKSEYDSVTNFSQSDTEATNDDKDTEIQFKNDNEMLMIIVNDTDKLTCSKCNIKFNNKEELKKHQTENHQSIPAYKKTCDICNKLIDKIDYRGHIKEHRNKYKEKHNRKYGKVDCNVCGKQINKGYLKYHMKMHGSPKEQAERTVECTICKKSVSSHYFSDHVRRVHDKHGTQKPQSAEQDLTEFLKLIKCPVCDKDINENIFKQHLAKHGGFTRRYICDQCGKEFKYPSAFKTHTLTHGSELKYQCQFCPYRGLHQGLLKIHVRTHTKDYNYKCPECPAKFITKSNLSKHLNIHKGNYNVKCDICDKGFYAKRNLDKHIKTVHLNLKNHVCEICGKGFGHRDNLLCHQLRVHKREKLTTRRGAMPSYLKKEHQQ